MDVDELRRIGLCPAKRATLNTLMVLASTARMNFQLHVVNVHPGMVPTECNGNLEEVARRG